MEPASATARPAARTKWDRPALRRLDAALQPRVGPLPFLSRNLAYATGRPPPPAPGQHLQVRSTYILSMFLTASAYWLPPTSGARLLTLPY